MKHRIDTVEARAKLKPRTPPYWHKLETGRHVGFRKMAAGSEGTWLAQAYDPATSKQTRRSIGDFAALPLHQRFDAASKAARAWFEHLGHGGSLDVVTVKEACDAYARRLRGEGRGAAADDAESRFARWVSGDPIASIELPKLSRAHVRAWRRTLEATPVIAAPMGNDPGPRERAASSVNRDMTSFRAALNHAHDEGNVTSDMAWRVALRPIKNADGRREIYLDREQRRRFIEHAAPDLALFLGALGRVPLRPGALAALDVGDFDRKRDLLTVRKDKTDKVRTIPLPKDTADFFREACKGALPASPLLRRADGARWDKDSWKYPVKAAATAAGLPAGTVAYSVRHSTITDLVTNGLDLVTAALLSGTSVAMIEKHYGHLRQEHAREALARLAL